MLKKHADFIRKLEYLIDFLIGLVLIGLLIKLSKNIELGFASVAELSFTLGLSQVLIFRYVGLYGSRRFYSVLKSTGLIIRGTILHMIFASCFYSIIQFFIPISIITYSKLLGSYYIFSTLLFFAKGISVKLGLFYLRGKGFNQRYVLLVGDRWNYMHAPDSIFKHNRWGLSVLGYVCPQSIDNHRLNGLKYLGGYSNFIEIIKSNVVDEIIFLSPFSNSEQYKEMIKETVIQGKNCHLYSVTKEDFINIYKEKLKISSQIVKRAFDFVSSLLLLALFLPIMLVISIAVKVTSPGPIFFKQQRTGKNGRLFTLYKFRSMVIDAEEKKQELMKYNEMEGPVFKIAKDPRITNIGNFLRKTSLDELPQIFNVLKGDMSLVGPRPPIPEEVNQYENWQRKRLAVMPGITCTWQVSGRNQITSFEDWVKLDIDYIDNYSFMNDIKLLFKTIPAVLSSRGSS
jgi:exopolysaccharide biosynthesis polyprenyl glycosylphosphotransferase